MYHSPTCEQVLAHVRDTYMKFLGINKCKFDMLATCRKCYGINNVHFSSTHAMRRMTEKYSQILCVSCNFVLARMSPVKGNCMA